MKKKSNSILERIALRTLKKDRIMLCQPKWTTFTNQTKVLINRGEERVTDRIVKASISQMPVPRDRGEEEGKDKTVRVQTRGIRVKCKRMMT